MDQSASICALPASALYIAFFPAFAAEPVPLPITRTRTKAVWVCANSLVVSDKVVGPSLPSVPSFFPILTAH